jgi:hypothetical protein
MDMGGFYLFTIRKNTAANKHFEILLLILLVGQALL